MQSTAARSLICSGCLHEMQEGLTQLDQGELTGNLSTRAARRFCVKAVLQKSSE